MNVIFPFQCKLFQLCSLINIVYSTSKVIYFFFSSRSGYIRTKYDKNCETYWVNVDFEVDKIVTRKGGFEL